MSVQTPYILPLRGLGQGLYTYDLVIDDEFMASFPDAPVQRANVELQLRVDRRSREMTLDFEFSGTIATSCDRCTAAIDLPISDQQRLVVKFVPNPAEFEDEVDIVFLDAEHNLFNVAPYAYEFVLLAIPMIRTYDCREGEPPYPCDEDLLNRIEGSYDDAAAAASGHSPAGDDGSESSTGSPWDVLKNLN